VARLASLTAIGLATAGCSGNLPSLGAGVGGDITSSILVSDANSNVVVGTPREIYEKIARRAQLCWFGPFGSVHDRYMMHADVPPPSSSAPVTMAVHRRLADLKKPWGPALMRVKFSGQTSTTLSFQNNGLERAVMTRMSRTITRWANGRKNCPKLHETDPPLAAAGANPAGKERR